MACRSVRRIQFGSATLAVSHRSGGAVFIVASGTPERPLPGDKHQARPKNCIGPESQRRQPAADAELPPMPEPGVNGVEWVMLVFLASQRVNFVF
jgi:hypothetical protein